MEAFGLLMHGFVVLMTWKTLALMMVGLVLGIFVGVLPGLGGPNVNTPINAPASNRLRGADEPIIMTSSPVWKPYPRAVERLRAPAAFLGTLSNIFPSIRNRKHILGAAGSATE